jgi:class 3 adenylate cyclase
MSFVARLQRAREILAQQGRLSRRALERELGIAGTELDELIDELVDVQQVARRDEKVLVWVGVGSSTRAANSPPHARAADAAEVRKVVTIVFADLIGSTALHERLDPESVSRLMDRYYRAVRVPVEAHGGTVVQLLGDGVMCAFGVPRVAEDDAIRAVRAAVAMQRAFRDFAAAEREAAGTLGLRVAVNTGEVVVSDEHAAGIGDPLNVAARLQQEARDGDVLIGEATQRLVRGVVTLAPVGAFALKGRAEPVAAFRVVSLERPAGAAAIGFVGRDDELRRIRAVYDAAVAAPATRLAVVLGSPGLGKSRLLDEFASRLGAGAALLSARCDPTGGATFAPLAEALRVHLCIDTGAGGGVGPALDAVIPDGADRPRIAAGIGALLAGTPAAPEETFFVVRRLLAALATARPVVLMIDDVQWAEPLLLDLVEHLVQWGTGTPLLVLAAARPDLRELRSSLTQPGGLVADVVTLAGLEAGAATRLAANVIGADELPAAVAGRVLTASEGNPLFVGELVRMLVNDGALRQEGNRWTAAAEVATLEMPPTIQALLAARIERLRPEDRLVLERAAVVGRHFSRAAVAHLLPGDAQAALDARFESLRRSELVEPDTGWLLGEPVLRFHHALIRDAAYRRLLRHTRAELHERFAEWLVGRAGESIEHDETIGWHLEQAHQHLRELGPLDAAGRTLGERAAGYLAAAGRRALARDDLLPAANLLGRAHDRLMADDPARADLLIDWCEALLAAGDVGPAAKAIDELARFASDERRATSDERPGLSDQRPATARLRAWHACFAGQLAVLTDPQALHASERAVAAAAETLTAAGDTAGEAKAHAVHALVLAQLGRIGACETALDQALAAARRAGERRRANAVLAGAPLAALWGPSPVTRASGRCLDVVRVLRITQGAPAVEAVALRCQAVLETLRGRGEAARRMIASSRALVEELGITQRVLEADLFAGLIELLEGDPAAAERWLRSAWDGLRAEGLGIDAAQAGALLARALLAQTRIDEAEAVSFESEALAGDSFKAAIAWRGVRAEVLAARGDHGAAIELARAAVEIAAATDALLDHADAHASLAVALRAAGRGAEAEAEERRAIELWEAKGATLLVARTQRPAPAGARVASAPVELLAPSRTSRPRVHGNHATRHIARLDEAVAARDLAAVESLVGNVEVLDHLTGASYTPLDLFRLVIERYTDMGFVHEPLAALGSSLALARWRESGSGVLGGDFPVGPFVLEGIVLVEADPEARAKHVEVFAADRLGDAVARLYERYAELLPEGPERTRATAIARSAAALGGPLDLARFAAAFAPAIEFVDHRSLGLASACGAEAVLGVVASLVESAPDSANRIDDVLALQSDAMLLRMTNLGTLSLGGGSYERPSLILWTFGADGLVTRSEQFDPDRKAEALARFDALSTVVRAPEPRAAPSPSVARRRVRANLATAAGERFRAAALARDMATIAALCADDIQVHHHPTGALIEREGGLNRFRMLGRAEGLTFSWEPLATLGDFLELGHDVTSFDRLEQDDLSFGAARSSYLNLMEVNARGLATGVEVFADDRLGDAVVRLYERHAELLPEGPERRRAAAIAGSISVWKGAIDFARLAASLDPSVEVVDHRVLGTWTARGAAGLTRQWRDFATLARDSTVHQEDVLALRPDLCLLRATFSGTDRAGGGQYTIPLLALLAFGASGLLVRGEIFDPDREAEALARFDELVLSEVERLAEPQPKAIARRVRPNAASANTATINAAIAAQDLDAVRALHSDAVQNVDQTTGAVLDLQQVMEWWRLFFGDHDAALRITPVATLGDSLVLNHLTWSGSASSDAVLAVGPFEGGSFDVVQVDAQGRAERVETFGPVRLADAILRLYERHAELMPDGPERARAAAIASSVAELFAPAGSGRRLAAILAADAAYTDHRPLGFPPLRGRAEIGRWLDTLFDVAADVHFRLEELIDLRPDGLLGRWVNTGTVGGGEFERAFLSINVFDADGLLSIWEQFATDHEAEALARFDVLVPSEVEGPTATHAIAAPGRAERPGRRVHPNAVSTFLERGNAAIQARDVDTLAALHADGMRGVVHTAGLVLEKEEILDWWRLFFGDRGGSFPAEPLAVLGDTLMLYRQSWAGGSNANELDVGVWQSDSLALAEVDAEGRAVHIELFDEHRLADAVVRLYERYAELRPAGPERERAAATARTLATLARALDLDRFGAVLAAGLEFADHRPLGFPASHTAEAFLRLVRTLVEEAGDLVLRAEGVLDLRPGALLLCSINSGTLRRGGGAFERPFLVLWVFGADGRLTHWEHFAPEQEAEALARFDELVLSPVEGLASAQHPPRAVRHPVRPNAATEWLARTNAAIRAGDLDAIRALHDEGLRAVHHAAAHVLDREEVLSYWRLFSGERGASSRTEPIAALGDSLLLYRQAVTGGSDDVSFNAGVYELDVWGVAEVDRDGRATRIEVFAADHLADSVTRLYERYAELLPEGPERIGAAAAARSIALALGPYDVDRYATAMAPDITFVDHRLEGSGPLVGAEATLRWFGSLLDLAEAVANRFDDVVALASNALLIRWTNVGTERAGGGAYERHFLWLGVFGSNGLIERIEQFGADSETEARARFEELSRAAPARFDAIREGRRDPLCIPPNAATRASDRVHECVETGAWEALRELCAPILFEDRRRLIRTTGGCEMAVANGQVIAEAGGRYSRTLLATAGDRLVLEHLLVAGPHGAVAFEVEVLRLLEVDDDGRLRAAIIFDPDDRRAAYAEMFERYGRSEEARHVPAVAVEAQRAMNAHDLGRFRAALADDFALSDHRRTGLGRLTSPDEYVAAVAALFEQAPDIAFEPLYIVAAEPHGMLVVQRASGTLAVGGGEFEQVYALLACYRDGQIGGIEFFEPEDLDRARARFEELRGSA